MLCLVSERISRSNSRMKNKKKFFSKYIKSI